MAKPSHRLTTRKVLLWADAHFRRTGRWPTYRSGIILDAPDEDWSCIDGCLEYGGFGLPGGSSLVNLLARHRGLISGLAPAPLSIQLILVWADRHHIRTGVYPTCNSGGVTGVRGESWRKIDSALQKGHRGLPGGSSVARLLAKHRGKALWRRDAPHLEVNQILAWADEHRARTGFWPKIKSGAVKGRPGDSWVKIDNALRYGLRGLPGDSSIAQLLSERRGKKLRTSRRHLTVALILDWADRHRKQTGVWPRQQAEPVHNVPGENWRCIDEALRDGRGGLPGGSSLPTLLAKYRGRQHMGQLPPLTVPMILNWAEKHHRRTGKWPSEDSGPVRSASGESWRNIGAALQRQGRGLPVRTSLSQLLADHRGTIPMNKMPKLTIRPILSWADRHRARSGDWPIETSGDVVDAPENTWSAINAALTKGYRGLPGGSSLARLLADKRGKRVRALAPRLTITQILRWADNHHRRTGAWPVPNSGPVKGAPAELWNGIDTALRYGHRGLAGGSSISRLLQKRRRVKPRRRMKPVSRKWLSARARRRG